MQKTAYEMRICDWSSDVCSSDLFLPRRPQRLWLIAGLALGRVGRLGFFVAFLHGSSLGHRSQPSRAILAESFLKAAARAKARSEEHTSELQSLMRISYAVFCLKKKNKIIYHHNDNTTLQSTLQTFKIRIVQ